jgi:hypothetical protein
MTLQFAVGTIIGPVRVALPSEFIIVASAAAAQMQSKVGGGFEILENYVGAGVVADETMGNVSPK